MSNKISTGAYVIRNRSTSLVLHTEATHKNSPILCFEQDENQYRDQQIWWVEPLPKTDVEEEDMVYTISNNNSRSMDQAGEVLYSYSTHGGTWQTWKIKKVRTGNEGDCYIITNACTSKAIGIKDTKPFFFPKEDISDDSHCWEFVIPIVSFPVGWFQIQNIGTGDLLTHKSLYNPPILLNPPASPEVSQELESWGTQWTLAQVGTVSPAYTCTTGKNSWYIINRLTTGLLSNPTLLKKNSRCVVAWGQAHLDARESLWRLELDPASNWTIMHHNTALLLEQATTSDRNSTEVVCAQKWLNLEGPNLNQSWAFTSPVLEKTEEMSAYLQRLALSKDSTAVPRG